jgi:protein-disulfide isomerase
MNQIETTLAIPVSPDDHIKGPAWAPVTVVEYGDYQCPYCAMAHPVVKQIEHHYAGNLRYVYRHFPLTQAHPFAKMAAAVSEVAAQAGRFWPMHDWLFENQELWSPVGLPALLQGLRTMGIDRGIEAISDPEIEGRINRDFMGGVRSGVNGTPSFFVNGHLLEGGAPMLARAIGSLIARRG